MARELQEVVYVDGVRTAFGQAGPGGLFWKTRADDMGVKVVRELLRRSCDLVFRADRYQRRYLDAGDFSFRHQPP